MTLGGRIVSLFPVFHLLLVFSSIVGWVSHQSAIYLFFIFVSIYAVPVLVFRMHNLVFPLEEGTFDISAKKYSVWWATYQFQFLFITFPILEGPWHFIPGGFSFWLRLWGSKIGKNVLWTPRVEVVDRGLLEVGSNVVVGHLAAFCCHAIMPRQGKALLIVKKITLGDACFIGADSQFGPGASVPANELIKAKSAIYWKGGYQ